NIRETSWDREERTPEFQKIKSDLEALRIKIYERKPSLGVTEAGPLADMAYDATSSLLNAAREVLTDPERAADLRYGLPEGVPPPANNPTRNGVLNSLVEVMGTLHITPQDLADTIARKRKSRDS